MVLIIPPREVELVIIRRCKIGVGDCLRTVSCYGRSAGGRCELPSDRLQPGPAEKVTAILPIGGDHGILIGGTKITILCFAALALPLGRRRGRPKCSSFTPPFTTPSVS